MNKKIIIVAAAILVILLIIIGLVTFVINNSNKNTSVVSDLTVPSITSVPLVESQLPVITVQPTPIVLSSSPANGQQQVPVTTRNIVLQFQGTTIAKSEDVTIRIDPPTQFSYRAKDRSVRITFLNNLEEGRIYSYSVSVNDNPTYIASFKTAGIGPTAKPGIEPPGFFEEQIAQQKLSNPDIYLSNLTPFESANFSINSEFVEKPNEYFRFIVTNKNSVTETALKNEVEKWVMDQGISGAQFSQLDIVYK